MSSHSLESMTSHDLERRLDELRDERALGPRLESLLEELEVTQESLRRQHQALVETQVELEETRHRYLELFESSPLAYLVLDRHGRILEVNLAAAELCSRRRDRLLGVPFASLLTESSIFARHLAEVTRTGGPTHHYTQLRANRGVPLEVELCTRRSLDGERFVMTLIDRRRTESDQREIERLRSREKSARDANETSARFCAMLAHELRTPLVPLVASAEVLDHDPELPARLRPVVARLRRNADAQARLIHEFLEAQRAHRGTLEVRRQPCDLHTLVHEALCSLGDAAGQIELELAAVSTGVHADPDRMVQVLTNLLRNALWAVRAAGSVRLTTRNPSATSLRIEVRDTGIGIDAATLERLFQPFERGPALVPLQPEGLGLGLWISKSLIDAHGGRIEVESDGIGHGSCFRIELPLLPDAVDATRPAPISPPRSPTAATTRNLHLLVVDDHVDSADALGCMLELMGHTVSVAHGAAEAIELAKRELDLLIIDLHLQDGDGLTLLSELRKRECSCPALVLSGLCSPSEVERSLSSGFVDHVRKPVDRNALTAAIERACAAGSS